MATTLKNRVSSAAPLRQKTANTAQKISRVSGSSKQKQADPIGTAQVTASSLNVRKGPGTNYERIGGLAQGKTIQVYEDTGDWLKIQYGTTVGYVMQKYTTFQDQKPPVTEPENPPVTEPEKPPVTDPNLPESVDGNAPTGATYTGTDTIKKGSTNKEAVKTIQLYLNKCMASSGVSSISVDGDFGNGTWKTLMYYQYSRNICDSAGKIDVDGVCGPATWKALRSGAPVVYDIREPIAFSGGKRLDANCTTKLSCGGAMAPNAAAKFEQLIAAAKAAGHTIKDSSTFRGMTSMGTTKGVGSQHDGQIELFVYWNGNTSSAAKPGYSNHQSGKAIDIAGLQKTNDTSALFKWLCNNAGKYDFENYKPECWHWNYIGN